MGSGWLVSVPGLATTQGGPTRELAIAATIEALRTYVEDWADLLQFAPGHWGIREMVHLVETSTDEHLAALIAAEQLTPGQMIWGPKRSFHNTFWRRSARRPEPVPTH